MSAENPMADLENADASSLAAMVASASDEQIAEGLAVPAARKRVLDEIFRRMGEHVEPDKVKGIDAIIHFRITEAPDGGIDIYEVKVADGEATVTTEPTTEDPRVSFQIAPVDFIRLVTGAASGPAMFMTGKIKIKGDVMFASQMTSLFRIPKG